jgi:hypothetical protein
MFGLLEARRTAQYYLGFFLIFMGASTPPQILA